MNRALYPDDWEAIATRIKQEAQWRCEQCGRPCRPPGVNWAEFCLKLLEQGGIDGWYGETSDEVCDDSGEWGIVEKPGRFTLTVAHLDQNPGNNDRANLKALCSPCHLRYDAPAHGRTRRRRRRERREDNGQLSLWGQL